MRNTETHTAQPIKITVYRITGDQLFFRVPESVCEECDLTVATAKRAIADLPPGTARLEVKPWLSHVLEALFRGGWHPPVVTVDGKLVSQGVVPLSDKLRQAVLEARS